MNSLLIPGTYLVFGPSTKPQVHMLDPKTCDFFRDRSLGTASRRADPVSAVRQTFGKEFDSAICAWNEATLRSVAEHYEGVWQSEVRAIAAALVVGMTFEELFQRQSKGGKNGGTKVAQPRRPVKPQPGGIAVAIPT